MDVFKEDGEDNEKEEVEFIHVNKSALSDEECVGCLHLALRVKVTYKHDCLRENCQCEEYNSLEQFKALRSLRL